jgi:hypothetical protein
MRDAALQDRRLSPIRCDRARAASKVCRFFG